MAPKAITSPVPESWYPALSVFMLAIGLVVTASFFMPVVRDWISSYLGPLSTILMFLIRKILILVAIKCSSIGLVVSWANRGYEATSSRRNRSLAKELTTGALASFFLGFGSLFLLLASGVYV